PAVRSGSCRWPLLTVVVVALFLYVRSRLCLSRVMEQAGMLLATRRLLLLLCSRRGRCSAGSRSRLHSARCGGERSTMCAVQAVGQHLLLEFHTSVAERRGRRREGRTHREARRAGETRRRGTVGSCARLDQR